ncbi:hypothetical protein OUZ56_023901 [Daphnia magna]|uniref:Uncharacterized protein n=1 Tax=Daphnia magna TaxID=35525 RepID=A0ABR0AZR5_9CRUS|nr:hypothetical protein OUZ56_023901 [Daphnia magna]
MNGVRDQCTVSPKNLHVLNSKGAPVTEKVGTSSITTALSCLMPSPIRRRTNSLLLVSKTQRQVV